MSVGRACSCCPPYKLRVGDYVGYLYRVYDQVYNLAYIGSAADLWNRLQVHMNQGEVGPFVNAVYYTTFDSIEDARTAEREAIERERPPLNRQYNPDYADLPRRDAELQFEAALEELEPADGPPVYILPVPVDGLKDRTLFGTPEERAAAWALIENGQPPVERAA